MQRGSAYNRGGGTPYYRPSLLFNTSYYRGGGTAYYEGEWAHTTGVQGGEGYNLLQREGTAYYTVGIT